MKLKTCPLCGGDTHIEVGVLGTAAVVCDCSTHVFFRREFDPKATAEAWNNRVGRTSRVKEDETGFLVCSECGAIQPEEWTVYYCWSCGARVVE